MTINLDDYESIFDAVSVALNDKREKKHQLSDVIDFPVTGKDDEFKVKDLKQKTEGMIKDGVEYLVVSKESKLKNRVVRIDRYAADYIRYTNVCLDEDGNELKETRSRMYDFSLLDEPDYLDMYVELLYEIKHYK